MFKFIGENESNIDTCITPWTFKHFLSGVYITYLLKFIKKTDIMAFVIYNLIHLIYELKDYILTYYYKNTRLNDKGKPNMYYNSFINSIGDLIFGMLGSILILYIIAQNNKILTNNIFIVFTGIYILITLIFFLGFYKLNIG